MSTNTLSATTATASTAPDTTAAASAPAKTVASTSDDRTVNNVMRHEYKVLSEDEKTAMQKVKDLGLELHNLFHKIGGTVEGTAAFATRELSIAGGKVEEAVMWSIKSLTK